ncbi:MAG TPA: ATP-binding cassette domain-containing protein [Bacteroidota bacterium]|nr:ATP-binding cassette domain-containing protein [Bacteroidota bacterium]
MITLTDVSLAIDGAPILRNVTLTVKEGETMVILGPSGAGKSSILKIILGIWKPDTGVVRIEDTDIVPLREEEMLPYRRMMGMVFQGNALFDSMTVRENIEYFLREQGKLRHGEIGRRVAEVLDSVNMQGTEDMYPEELSGGMKKRIAIARAISASPRMLLYDEPTTGLDPVNARAIDELINRFKGKGTTSIVVTHILHDAFAVGDSYAVMSDGAIVAAGSADDILASEDETVKKILEEFRDEASLPRTGASTVPYSII